jgi:hypothetical protein
VYFGCVEKKTQLDVLVLYWTYDMLNMFRTLLCPSSGALDSMYAIAAYHEQFLVACCRGSGARQQGMGPGRTPCFPAPDPNSQQQQ